MEATDKDFIHFIELIKNKTGIDLNQYKEAQMKRRLTTLRIKRGFSDFLSYFHALNKEAALMDEFLDRVTINVSEFYRNPNRWEALTQKIYPKLLMKNNRPKIWSAACSTGEEPYTLVMTLSTLLDLTQIHIQATDIDENVIGKAREGVYSERSLREVEKPIVHRFFEPIGDQWRLKDEVKRSVTFSKQNLLLDKFSTDWDLIVCRNVMIYFTEEAKHLLYQKFSDALRPGGFLFVGSTEQIFHPHQYGLEVADPFIYMKKE